jgi:hypothetical protein
MIKIIFYLTRCSLCHPQAIGSCSAVARLFGLVCPFISYLAVYWKPMPMVILGLPLTLVGIMMYFVLPETAGKDLPQNMQEGLELNKRRKQGV